MKYKAIIFDLDGTLINSLPDIVSSMNRVLLNHNLPEHSEESFRFFVGNGIENLVKSSLPDEYQTKASVQLFLDEYRNVYKEHCLDSTYPYPGIEDLLKYLGKRNIPTSVLSNKTDLFTKMMVNRIFNNHNFTAVQGAVDNIPIKPDPAAALKIAGEIGIPPEEIIFAGDSAVDIMTADRAGMVSAGVTWGIRPEEELLKAGVSFLIKHPKEFENLF